MTGYNQRDRIRGASSSDGPCRFGLTDGRRDFRIRACLAIRNAPEFIPDTPLKCGRPDVQRKMDMGLRATKMLEERSNGLRESFLVLNDLGFRVFAIETGKRFFG